MEPELFLGEDDASVEDERQVWKPLQALLELLGAFVRSADVLIEVDDERGQPDAAARLTPADRASIGR